MPWVVTRLCEDKVDTACAGECPVDCFYRPTNVDDKTPNRLYISPDECIDCGACEPACPWEAIFQDESVPDLFVADIATNALCDSSRDAFETAEEDPDTAKPTADDVASNKKRHGLA